MICSHCNKEEPNEGCQGDYCINLIEDREYQANIDKAEMKKDREYND